MFSPSEEGISPIPCSNSVRSILGYKICLANGGQVNVKNRCWQRFINIITWIIFYRSSNTTKIKPKTPKKQIPEYNLIKMECPEVKPPGCSLSQHQNIPGKLGQPHPRRGMNSLQEKKTSLAPSPWDFPHQSCSEPTQKSQKSRKLGREAWPTQTEPAGDKEAAWTSLGITDLESCSLSKHLIN